MLLANMTLNVQSFCYIYLAGWLTAQSYPFDFSIILFAIGLEITLSFCTNSSRCPRTLIKLQLSIGQHKPK